MKPSETAEIARRAARFVAAHPGHDLGAVEGSTARARRILSTDLRAFIEARIAEIVEGAAQYRGRPVMSVDAALRAVLADFDAAG